MQAALGGKILWRWFKSKDSLWGKIWRYKYAQGIDEQDLIRQTNLPTGSFIWNNTKAHLNMIHKHSFWEIRDGKTTYFWDDSWQQLPP